MDIFESTIKNQKDAMTVIYNIYRHVKEGVLARAE